MKQIIRSFTNQKNLNGNVGIIYLDPMEAFMIYDDSVLRRERYFVRLYRDEDNVLHGSVSDQEKVRWFTLKGKIVWDQEEQPHYFDGIPATEFRENKECQGIFEPVLSMINAFNKAISEKANDVDYFADAYLKIIGTLLDEDELKHIRRDRVINFDGDGESVIIDFLQKPDGDTTQEHLIDRLEKLIFQIAMVANISNENFGTSSGIAMAYKLQAMSNLRKTKERKFTSGMNRRYKLIFSNPGNTMKKDDWVKLHYKFTPNVPANLLEESQIVQNLSGVVSQETQIGVLSIVDNPKAEIERIDKEINGFYAKYAKAEGITMAEAKKRISQIDIDAYAKKAKRYVKDKDFSQKANEEMRYYNAAMKINRLELLKANIGMHLVGGYDEIEKMFGDAFTQRTEEEMRKQAGILGKTINDEAKKARAIVNASYKNATWSERIWAHQSMLKAEIDKLLQEGLIQGKHPSVLARHLKKRNEVNGHRTCKSSNRGPKTILFRKRL